MAPTSSSASDVIVVGAGTAGLAAAVAAAEAGARRVLVLEKSAAAEAGGNARFSHTGFRVAYAGPGDIAALVPRAGPARLELPGYRVERYVADLGAVDAALGARLAGDSLAAVRWMHSLGIPFGLNRSLAVDGRERFEPGLVLAAGGEQGGRGLIGRWLAVAAARGVDVRFDSPVEDVLPGTGVVAGGRLFAAPAIVVCSGGFQASARLRSRHLGAVAERAVVRGSRHDTGEVLEALLARGAARSGSWDAAVITPVDAASPPVEGGNRMNRYSYPYGITVDRDGRRFFDEGAGLLAETYGEVGRRILSSPGGTAWQLFDAAGERLLKTYAYRHAAPARGASIRELAVAAGLDPDALERTVADFNAACPDGPPLDPARPDGRATGGIEPPKSNWAVALREPPFSAYAVTGGLTFTLGGLAVDADARVLATSGAPLPGVFASGDAIGLFRGGYPSGAGQTRNVVFGRLAGAGAARAAARA